jgi:hypothetical protein
MEWLEHLSSHQPFRFHFQSQSFYEPILLSSTHKESLGWTYFVLPASLKKLGSLAMAQLQPSCISILEAKEESLGLLGLLDNQNIKLILSTAYTNFRPKPKQTSNHPFPSSEHISLLVPHLSHSLKKRTTLFCKFQH